MNRKIMAFTVATALAGGALWAQSTDHSTGMQSVLGSGAETMDHSTMDHSTMDQGAMDHGMMSEAAAPASPVSEPGQGAFAAIAEIVAVLEADPETDWEAVDIDALRAHLRDMDLVTIWAEVESEDTADGARFRVSGAGDVAGAIGRMVLAHAAIMEGVNDWHYQARETDTGAVLEVRVPESDRARLGGLGFFGILASGMHHQAHHFAMATGVNPHGH